MPGWLPSSGGSFAVTSPPQLGPHLEQLKEVAEKSTEKKSKRLSGMIAGPCDFWGPQTGSLQVLPTAGGDAHPLCAHRESRVPVPYPRRPADSTRVPLAGLHLLWPRVLPAGVAGLSALTAPRSSSSCSKQSRARMVGADDLRVCAAAAAAERAVRVWASGERERSGHAKPSSALRPWGERAGGPRGRGATPGSPPPGAPRRTPQDPGLRWDISGHRENPTAPET